MELQYCWKPGKVEATQYCIKGVCSGGGADLKKILENEKLAEIALLDPKCAERCCLCFSSISILILILLDHA